MHYKDSTDQIEGVAGAPEMHIGGSWCSSCGGRGRALECGGPGAAADLHGAGVHAPVPAVPRRQAGRLQAR